MKKQVDIPLGSVIGVPLQGGYSGLAVVMRRRERRRGPRETFFGVLASKVDMAKEKGPRPWDLKYTDCRAFLLTSDLSIRDGRWPVLGTVTSYSLDEWFIPPRVVRFADCMEDSEEDARRFGLRAGLLHDDCDGVSSCRVEKWISLADYNALPVNSGLGDAAALSTAVESLVAKGPSSYYWCMPTHERVRLWRELRQRMLAEDQAGKQ